MRYFHAKTTGRGECLFCLADIHALSYALQCSVVERLRAMCGTYGMGSAASLFFVSGKPRQVILHSLSDKMIDLPPLDIATLQASMAAACRMHCGETTCVVSDINGMYTCTYYYHGIRPTHTNGCERKGRNRNVIVV